MRHLIIAVMALLALTVSASAPAWSAPAAPQAERDLSWVKELQRRTGTIDLPQAKAHLVLGEDYYFLNAADTRRVLVDAWGNPPQSADGVLGMILPKRFSPVDEGSWAAVVTYDSIGYVSDSDARTADYDALLTELRNGEEENNRDRQSHGFDPVHLVGWAEAPSYDAGRHVVVWAKDLTFGADPVHTLNYDIRVLGRSGVLSLNVVASTDQLAEIKEAARSVAATAAFNEGARYADYNPNSDAAAGYGIAGLIAGGVGVAAAQKLGFLAILLAILKKGAVVIFAALAGGAAWVRNLFGGKKKPPASTYQYDDYQEPPPPPPSPDDKPGGSGGNIVS